MICTDWYCKVCGEEKECDMIRYGESCEMSSITHVRMNMKYTYYQEGYQVQRVYCSNCGIVYHEETAR